MNLYHLASWIGLLIAAVVLPLVVANSLRRAVQASLILASLAVFFSQTLTMPGWRLLCSSLLFMYIMKGVVLLAKSKEGVKRTLASGYLVFFTVWPGMAIDNFQTKRTATEGDVQGIGRGLLCLLLGIGIVLVDALMFSVLNPVSVAWIGLAGFLLAIHFGLSEVLTALLRLAGWPVDPLFRRPELSGTLEEFWGRRWNLPFVEMNRRVFVGPLVRRFGTTGGTVGVFIISGLLHEMAISYPVNAGWGLPTIYFIVQVIGALLQKRFKVRSRLLTLTFVLTPLPLLFHYQFLINLPYQLISILHNLISTHPPVWYLDKLVWIMASFQLVVLLASRQVPEKLNWSEDLAKLSSFNRKLMWTYGAFVVFTIVSFGVLTFVLHNDFLIGTRATSAFAFFVSGYWVLRLLFDNFYFKSEDWPRGPEFIIGHGLLNSLFTFLALSYGGLAVWGITR